MGFAAFAGKNHCNNCGTTASQVWMEGREHETLCQPCGLHWQKYRDTKPLTSRQLNVLRARADEHALASQSALMDSLNVAVPEPSQSTEHMMQAVMRVSKEPLTVLSLPMPPLPAFATRPPPLSARVSHRVYGRDGADIVGSVPFLQFSSRAAVQVRPLAPCGVPRVWARVCVRARACV